MNKKWPFDSKESAKLLWIKSPYRNAEKQWMTSLIFRTDSGETREFEIPWGLFPNYRIGQYYSDGMPVELFRDGSYQAFDLEYPEKGILCAVNELPAGLIYGDLPAIDNEFIWALHMEETIIYIPCIELVRCFLAPNGTLARALMEPNGLNLIAAFNSIGTHCRLRIDQSVPKNLVTDEFIYHLAWIYSNPLARNTWFSVFRDIRPNGDYNGPVGLFNIEEDINPKKLKVSLPLSGQSSLGVRGIQKDHHFLALEIVSAGQLTITYEDISYSRYQRPRKARQRNGNQVRRHHKKQKQTEPIIISRNPRRVSKTIISRNYVNMLSFKELPSITRFSNEKLRSPLTEEIEKRNSEKRVNSPEAGNTNPLNAKRIEINQPPRLISGAEVLFTGDPEVYPVEVENPTLISLSGGSGLDLFLETIDNLTMLDYGLIIENIKIDFLPAGRKFSRNEYGGPRKYACITIKFGKATRYILEVERFSKVYLSSLIIEPLKKPKFDDKEIYELLGELLNGLVLNYGKWNKRQIENHPMARIRKVKHLDIWSHYDWAIALYNRLQIPVSQA